MFFEPKIVQFIFQHIIPHKKKFGGDRGIVESGLRVRPSLRPSVHPSVRAGRYLTNHLTFCSETLGADHLISRGG